MRVYGIAGTRYCGSTVLGLCLGVADGVFTVGELEEIRQSDASARCRLDGERCEFWTPGFVDACNAEFDHAYDLVRDRSAEVLGASIVVHGDKAPLRYLEHAAGNQLDGLIVLFKRPEGFAFSAMTHDGVDVEDALDHYASTYRTILGAELPMAAAVFYDDFASDPGSTLSLLSAQLGISFRPEMTQYWEHPHRFHPISGNHGAFAHLNPIDNFRRIARSEYWQQTYGEAHIAWIEEHHRSISLDDKWRTGLQRRDVRAVRRHQGAQEVFQLLGASSVRIESAG